jgi:large subunit ribosomal protein L25
MSKYTLSAESRVIVGKQVKSLRAKGFLPATVYGKGVEPQTIAISAMAFTTLFKEAGETGLIDLTVAGKSHPVLIHMVQIHPVTRQPLHVEFHEVNLKEKVHAEIPVECVGEPAAVKEKLGVLLTLVDHIEVEALPTELPEKLTVDISHLSAIDEQVTVKDLTIPTGVTLLTDPTVIVAKIGAFVVEKEPEPTPTAEVAATEGTTEAPTGEGAAAEEAPKEGQPTEK